MKRLLGTQLAGIVTVALAACSATGGTGGGGEGLCAFIASYHGGSYEGRDVQVAPLQGRTLGAAIVPGCNDTGKSHDPPAEKLPVSRLPGVSPKVALAWSGHNDTILIRKGIQRLPG